MMQTTRFVVFELANFLLYFSGKYLTPFVSHDKNSFFLPPSCFFKTFFLGGGSRL